jgi:hypothetical protein
MKKSKFTEEQIAFALRQAEAVDDAVRRGIVHDEGYSLHRLTKIGRITTVSLLYHLFALFHANNPNGGNGTDRPFFL